MANTAIDAVTSEWFIPIGFDDFLYPNALDFQKIVRPDVDIVLASRDVTFDNIFVENDKYVPFYYFTSPEYGDTLFCFCKYSREILGYRDD